MPPKVLLVLTSQAKIPASRSPTGWYLPELAHIHNTLKDKVELTVASPKGGEAPLDPGSVRPYSQDDPVSAKFLDEERPLWTNTFKLSEMVTRAGEFEAVFYLGGHGPIFDLPTDIVSLAILQTLASAKKTIAAISHGPAALLNATTPSGTALIQGSTLTAFSNAEEDDINMSPLLPFLLETELDRISGGGYVKASCHKALEGKVVVSKTAMGGVLVTGQNAASARGVGEEVLRVLGV